MGPKGLWLVLAGRCRMADALIRLKTPIPGFYIYYPGRRELSPALAAFIDEVRVPAKSRATQPTKVATATKELESARDRRDPTGSGWCRRPCDARR